MNIYEKLKEMMCNESCDEKLYESISAEYYAKYPYETKDLGESMSLVSEVIGQWWKPRFILDHTAQRGYEFMNLQEYLVTVTEDDIDWDSLKNLPEKAVRRAEILSFHYPSHIYLFENGAAEVSWQLNPDGRYFMDDKNIGAFGHLIADCVFYEHIGPPAVAVRVGVKRIAVHRRDDIQRFAHRVAARLGDRCRKVFCHAEHIFHDLLRLFEDVSVDALEDIPSRLAVI